MSTTQREDTDQRAIETMKHMCVRFNLIKLKGGTLAACGQSPGIVLMRSHDTHTRAPCARETGAHVRIARVKQERTPALRAGEPVTCEGHSIFRGT